ncbi:MAG: thiol peroxidase [Gammaproteobacteria bacterium (ex Lamellibrachia satsuma)]|nr:MAG: thiol peroxidase [Gammaproteobacteria bacterium (ex Lamellibrachia satsuma)]RRS34174.1 MAG: thiol peroxidase [Gammaproteobacteria bacterium (ex Lamellibrachia satsuma)]RRS37616.1 MAG: thiol peroxidase [Gammaproteobacteria bacterium (ex Lamellibrachia satsuma)]
MAKITLKGNEINTSGELPAVGSDAPAFSLTAGDLSNKGLGDFSGKKVLLNIVPSLDTATCAASARKFNENFNSRDDAVCLVISCDLPFAQGRFCTAEGLENVVSLSLMKSKAFAKDYGLLITDGPLEGLCSRAIVIVEGGKVTYTQQVPEIVDEPDYDAALKALG